MFREEVLHRDGPAPNERPSASSLRRRDDQDRPLRGVQELVGSGAEQCAAQCAFAVVTDDDHRGVVLVGGRDETVDRPAVHELTRHGHRVGRAPLLGGLEQLAPERLEQVALVDGAAGPYRGGLVTEDDGDGVPGALGERDPRGRDAARQPFESS